MDEINLEFCQKCGEESLLSPDAGDASENWGDCLKCGFHFETVEGWHNLDEVNELRQQASLEPLKELSDSEVIEES